MGGGDHQGDTLGFHTVAPRDPFTKRRCQCELIMVPNKEGRVDVDRTTVGLRCSRTTGRSERDVVEGELL